MTFCRRCGAAKKTDLGPFRKSCAQHFNAIKRGHHPFAAHATRPHANRGHGRNRRNAITLPPLPPCAVEQGR
jgi:hypothetical protein